MWLKYYPITIKKMFICINSRPQLHMKSIKFMVSENEKKKKTVSFYISASAYEIYKRFPYFSYIECTSFKIGFWVLRPLRCSWSSFGLDRVHDEWCVKRKTQNPCYTRNPYKFNKPMHWLITNIPGEKNLFLFFNVFL